MRKTLVLFFWLVATVGLTYVANFAVELVDRQVLPAGSKIEALSFPENNETSEIVETAQSFPSTSIKPELNENVFPEETKIVGSTTTVFEAVPTTTFTLPETESEPVSEVLESESEVLEPELEPALESEELLELDSEGLIEIESEQETTPIFEEVVSVPTTTILPTTSTQLVPELKVLTTELPKGKVGSSFGFQLIAEGGIPPYEWSLQSGLLPNELKLAKNGLISGVLSDYSEASLVFLTSDSLGKTAISSEMRLLSESNRKTVSARGGTAFIDIDGDLVSLFLVSPADGYSAVIVESGGFRVEVQFVPLQGDSTSFVICEVNDGVVCTSD